MSINKKGFKIINKEEYPHLIFLRSNKAKYLEEYDENAKYINDLIGKMKVENSKLINTMNYVMWEEKEEEFRYPMYVTRNKLCYLPSAYYFKISNVNGIMNNCMIPYQRNEDLFNHFEKIDDFKELWNKEKEQILEQANINEIVSSIQIVKSFINEYKKYGHNLEYVMKEKLSPTKLQNAKKNFLALNQLFSHLEKLESCKHKRFALNEEKTKFKMTCSNCKLSFQYTGNKWKLIEPLSKPVLNNIEEFAEISRAMDIEQLDIIKVAKLYCDLNEYREFYNTKNLNAEIDYLMAEMDSLKETTKNKVRINMSKELIRFRSLKKPLIKHYNKYDNIYDWIRSFQLKDFEWCFKKDYEPIEVFSNLIENFDSLLTELYKTKTKLVNYLSNGQETPFFAMSFLKGTVNFSQKELLPLLSFIKYFDGKYGRTTFAEGLTGSDSYKMRRYDFVSRPEFGKLEKYGYVTVLKIIDELIKEEYFEIQGYEYPKVALTEKGRNLYFSVLNGDSYIEVVVNQLKQGNFVDFLKILPIPNFTKKAKKQFIKEKLDMEGIKFYRQLVEAAQTYQPLISYLEPLISDFFEDKYQPVFRRYSRTKGQTKFGKMVSRILTKKEKKNVSEAVS